MEKTYPITVDFKAQVKNRTSLCLMENQMYKGIMYNSELGLFLRSDIICHIFQTWG